MEFLYISANVGYYTHTSNVGVVANHILIMQLTELVQREVLRESAVEDQTSVLSYFIQTAKVISNYNGLSIHLPVRWLLEQPTNYSNSVSMQ